MIQMQHIEKAFGEQVLFHDYNLEIPEGKFVVILGESGCGKTTLLDMLGGLEKPDKGKITLHGQDISLIGKRKYFGEEVGFLFQNFALMEEKTVLQNLQIISKHSRNNITIEEALGRVGLLDKMEQKVYRLSGGEQQRVALARLILKRCNLILADEPTGSLDEKNAELVTEQLQRLQKEEGRTVVMVTHNREFAKIADMVVELHK